MMRWILMPLRRYFDFAGRSCRKEFWSFFLLQWIGVLALIIWMYRALVAVGLEGETGHSVTTFTSFFGPVLSLFGLFVVVMFIPSISVQVRRFHDQNLSGWLVLLNVLPGIGGIVVLFFMCLKGTSGSNRYGPDPLEPMQY